MSSEMFMLDENLYQHLGPTIFSPDISGANFFTHDHISTLSDSSIDSLLQEISSSDDHNNNQNTTTTTTPITTQISADHEVQSLDQIAHSLLSNSPPSHQLETLSLSQQQQNLGNSSCNLGTGFGEYSSVSHDVKTEDFQLAFDSYLLSNSYNENESLVKFMQRSYSSNSFDGKPAGFVFQPRFDSFLETQNFQTIVGSPEIESSFSTSTGQMRRVCSTGDLPEVRMNQTAQQRVCTSNTTATTTTGSFGEGNSGLMEEGNFKVGRYSAEERKERIDRYRAKRTQRNFNKTIKYACRKTLADNRPRIRGRFARNDETGEIPNKPTCFHPSYEDDDDLWVDNLQEEEDERMLGRGGGRFLSNFGGTQFQYCGY